MPDARLDLTLVLPRIVFCARPFKALKGNYVAVNTIRNTAAGGDPPPQLFSSQVRLQDRGSVRSGAVCEDIMIYERATHSRRSEGDET